MDYEVDVICAATAGKLMIKGVAEKLHVKAGHPRTVYDWIRRRTITAPSSGPVRQISICSR